MAIAHQADWCVCVCECVCVCVCACVRACVGGSVTVVRLVTAGWKRCVWVCDVDTGAVDLGRLAT